MQLDDDMAKMLRAECRAYERSKAAELAAVGPPLVMETPRWLIEEERHGRQQVLRDIDLFSAWFHKR